MDRYILDDSADSVKLEDIEKVEHLDPDKSYVKLILLIDKCLDPNIILQLNFDYESVKLLLQQAKDLFGISFTFSDTYLALFISKCNKKEVRQKLFKELGFGEPKKTAQILDPHLYKYICNDLQYDMDIEDIQKYRKLLLKELVLSDDFLNDLSQNRFTFTVNSNYYFNVNKKFSTRTPEERLNLFFLDLIAEYFFDDYYENICIDVNQMLKYIELTKNHDIPSDRLSFYEEFSKLREHSMIEQQEFFRNHINDFVMDSFYDDMRLLKDLSYRSLIDACTKFTPDSPLYNKKMSETYGCDIYYLDGEEFYGIVRSDVDISKNSRVANAKVPTKDKIRKLNNSFTYIGTGNIQTYRCPNEILTMLYTGIDYRTIEHVFHNDSETSPNYHSDPNHYCNSPCPNELHTPESLLRESTFYTEIFIKDLQGIEPCALVCFDKPSNWDVEFSKKNNLPIVVINSKKYEIKNAQENHVEHYTR